MPGPFGWTHGDLQFRSILRDGGVVSAVLDWDRIAVRPLGEEVARTAQVQFGGELGYLDLERVAALTAGYGRCGHCPGLTWRTRSSGCGGSG